MCRRMTVSERLAETWGEATGESTDGRANPDGRLWASRESVGQVSAVVRACLTLKSRRLTLMEGF
jgi:hypothetical protein